MGKYMSKRSRTNLRHEEPTNVSEVASIRSSHDTPSYNSRLEMYYDKQDTDLISLKQWHQRMQAEHSTRFGSVTGTPNFSSWGWCNCLCSPCRHFESIDYNKKICVYCLEFKTFKSWMTGIFIIIFFYILLLQFLGNDILPGGTYFYLFIMFITSFAVGNILFSYDIPGTIGHIVIGILFANLPFEVDYKQTAVVKKYSEKIMLLIVVIRAALFVDFAHLYGHVSIIAQLALIPYSAEFAVVLLFGHYLMKLPWAWSALQGALIAPVSLASTITIMEKSKKFIFSESTKVPTIVIAANSIQKIITVYIYSILMAVLFSKGILWTSTWWSLSLVIVIQLVAGAVIGVLLGCLAGMFPDRRSFGAPYSRIIFIGVSTAALIFSFNNLGMIGVGVLSSSTMIVIASSAWEELGWHENSNPVLYFYSLLYYFAQPIGISLGGFSLQFQKMPLEDIGLAIGINLVGTTVRELLCLAVLQNPSLKMNKKQKLYVIIFWFAKGSAEALLASVLSDFVQENFMYIQDDGLQLPDLLNIAHTVLQTTVFGMLLTTPIASMITAILNPIYTKK